MGLSSSNFLYTKLPISEMVRQLDICFNGLKFWSSYWLDNIKGNTSDATLSLSFNYKVYKWNIVNLYVWDKK